MPTRYFVKWTMPTLFEFKINSSLERKRQDFPQRSPSFQLQTFIPVYGRLAVALIS